MSANTPVHNDRMFTIRLAVLLTWSSPHDCFCPGDQPPAITLPTVIVTAQKEAADVKVVPGSVTAVTDDTHHQRRHPHRQRCGDSSRRTRCSPSSRRARSATRGSAASASSPANPAITTYIDGVPQLNSNSSNIELLDVNQIEFVRGPQSPLFGRNTLGGIVNITSAQAVDVRLDRIGRRAVRQRRIEGSARQRLGTARRQGGGRRGRWASRQRDGYTTNTITGNDLDFRDGTFAKAQLMLTPNAKLGGARHLLARAQSRRRLRAGRSRRHSRRIRSRWRATSRASPTATSTTPRSTSAAAASGSSIDEQRPAS